MRNRAFKIYPYVQHAAAVESRHLVLRQESKHRNSSKRQVSAVAGSGIVLEPKGAVGRSRLYRSPQDAPLASYQGGVQGLNATTPALTGANKLNVNSAEQRGLPGLPGLPNRPPSLRRGAGPGPRSRPHLPITM